MNEFNCPELPTLLCDLTKGITSAANKMPYLMVVEVDEILEGTMQRGVRNVTVTLSFSSATNHAEVFVIFA
jgi:hypothetical protein